MKITPPMKVWPPISCTSGSCVDVKRHDDGVTLTSTIDGNNDAITYTHDEWDTFGRQVKNGDWDHTFDL
jgi:hypothetical protein